METTTRAAGQEVLERFLAAEERGDETAMRACVHPDVTMEWPQSGERFIGVDNAIAAIRATEEKPEFAGEPRLVGDGDVWVLTMPLTYGTETSYYIGLFELEDGLIRRATEYFGAPFPAPASRAPFADAPGSAS